MILRKIELRSFRQFVHADITLDQGITAIVGANGSGKTTILEAVKVALYGADQGRGKVEDCVNMFHGGDMSVAVEFELQDGFYRCERSRKNASLFRTVNGETSRIAFSLKGVSEHVAKILGLTAEQFSNSYYTEQKELKFLSFSSKDRVQREVAEMLGIEVLATASKNAKEKSKACKNAFDELQRALEGKDILVADIKAKSEDRDAAHAQLNASKKDLKDLQDKMESLEKRSKDAEKWRELDTTIRERADFGRTLQEDIESVKKQIDQARKEVEERDSLSKPASEYSSVKKKHDEMITQRGALTEREKWEHERDTKSKDLVELENQVMRDSDSKLDTAEKHYAKASKARDDAQNLHADLAGKWQLERTEAKSALKRLQERLDENEIELKVALEAEAKGICPTCGQSLPNGKSPRSAALESQIAATKKEMLKAEQTANRLEGEPAPVTAALKAVSAADEELKLRTQGLEEAKMQAAKQSEIAARVGKLKESIAKLKKKIDAAPTAFDQAAFELLGEQLNALEPKWTQWQKLSGAADRLAGHTKDLQEKQSQFESEKQRQAADKKKMEELDFDATSAASAISDYSQAKGSLPHLKQRIQDAEASCRKAAAALKEAEERLARWQENADRLEQHRHDRDLYGEVGDAMNELRTQLNQEIRPTLEYFAADALAQITASRYSKIAIDDSFKATIVDKGYKKNVISGGEEDALALSLRIALSRYIQEKSGLPLSLLILDEVFGSLDSDRRANVLELLDGLKGMFPQIILISHVEGFSDHADRILRVTYDPEAKKSTVEEVAAPIPAAL